MLSKTPDQNSAALPVKVTFITPTLNASRTVRDTILAVRREASGIQYEHIFVDGGSTDSTNRFDSR